MLQKIKFWTVFREMPPICEKEILAMFVITLVAGGKFSSIAELSRIFFCAEG